MKLDTYQIELEVYTVRSKCYVDILRIVSVIYLQDL